MADTPKTPAAEGETFPVSDEGVIWEAPPEKLVMNPYHFMWVIDRMRRRVVPHGEWWLIPAGMFLSLVLVLLTTDFKDRFGIDKHYWAAAMGIITFLTAIIAVALLSWWLYSRWKNSPRSSEQILADIIAQMQHDQERVAAEMASRKPKQ
jgi:hypothetical protein